MDIETGQGLTVELAQALFENLCESQTIDIKKLAETLGVKRLALQQALNWLEDAGLVLEPAGPERWRLDQPMQPLAQLHLQTVAAELPIHYVFSSASTNTKVKDNSILIADHQSQGQGRSGKKWVTPPGQSICLSYCRVLPQDAQTLSGLSIVTALSVMQTLQHFQAAQDVQLKWPNDVYRNGLKAGGILLQLEPTTQKQHRLVIGVGLNWNVPESILESIDQPCTNLVENTDNLDRATFLMKLLETLHHNVNNMLENGLSNYIEQWQQHDFLLGKEVRIRHGLRTVEGRYQGLDPMGMLTIENNGEQITLASGEVSVRPL